MTSGAPGPDAGLKIPSVAIFSGASLPAGALFPVLHKRGLLSHHALREPSSSWHRRGAAALLRGDTVHLKRLHGRGWRDAPPAFQRVFRACERVCPELNSTVTEKRKRVHVIGHHSAVKQRHLAATWRNCTHISVNKVNLF